MAEEKVRDVVNLIENKRLFVGGLYEGVSEQDLRLKFKLFGDVKDLEIISRHEASSGDHIKTFAYLNIDMSEKNFRKCLTTYNKCKWKNHILKVEVAKEDYLTRLQKENPITVSIDETKDTSNINAISDIKSAVPGTPVPKKRNWVIGKFGRALPIVFLRRKDGKKIAKFDPSKTVHCLKKLSENKDLQDHCVDNLTWSLDNPDTILNGVHKMTSTNTFSMKRPYQEIEEDPSYHAKAKIRTRKNYSKSVQWQNNKTVFNGFNSDDCIVKSRDEPTLFSSINRSFDNDGTIVRSSSDESDLKNLHVMSSEDDFDSDECSALSNCSSNSDSRQIKGQDQRNKATVNPCHNASSLEDSTEQKESKYKSDYKQHSVDQLNFSSSSESFSSTDEESDQVPERKKHSNSVASSSVDVIRDDETDANGKQISRSFKAESEQSRNKKELSNKLRLETLEERKEVLRTQKEIVKNALQKVDTGPVKGANHVVFENGNTCIDEKHTSLLTDTKKISGSKAHAWLGMDSSSDENDDSNQSVDEFLGKEHFDGRSGEKLMKLQQKFGHDQRFKMDERFLESDDDEMELTLKTPGDEGDDLGNQLKEEKLLSLKVLHDVLGTNSVFVEEDEDARNIYRDSTDTHYDPSREDHAKFEQEIKSIKNSKKTKESNITDDVPRPAADKNVATQEKFYSVSDSLKGLFGKKDQKNSTFSFSLDLDEKEDHCESVVESNTDWKAPVKLSQALPYDSSASESEEDVEESTKDVVSSIVNTKKCLFYHPVDQGMMEALRAESSGFMRKESVENLTRYWVDIRQTITQDYKKKRKDALRRQKKTSYRRV